MDSWRVAHSLLPIAGLAVNAAAHIAMSRKSPKADPVVLIRRAFAVGLVVMAALELAMPGHWLLTRFGSMALELLTYGALGYCYAHFVNLGATARRIRMLVELSDAPDGLTEAELFERYSAIEILGRRIARLEDNAEIRREGGRMYTGGSRKVLFMARAITALKMILLGKKSEFER